MRRLRNVLVALVFLAVAVGGGLWLEKQLRIDACLDRGGRWDYAAGTCLTS